MKPQPSFYVERQADPYEHVSCERIAETGKNSLSFPWHLDPRTQYDEWRAWWDQETRVPEKFLLGTYGANGDVVVEFVLAPKKVDRFMEREKEREAEVAPVAPMVVPKVKKPKKTTARKVAAAEARDDTALKERPQDVTEFSLTSPSEKELKTMKRRK